MGIVVSFRPDEYSPFNDLPWIVTFKPRDGEDDWDSIICGPYRREHAEALAEAVALDLDDDDIVAVAEPMLTALDPETVRGAIQRNRDIAAAVDEKPDEQEFSDHESEEFDDEVENLELPDPMEIREGVERVMRQLLSALHEVESPTLG